MKQINKKEVSRAQKERVKTEEENVFRVDTHSFYYARNRMYQLYIIDAN